MDAVCLAIALDRPVYERVYLALAYRIGTQVVVAEVRLAAVLAATGRGEAALTLADCARMQS